MKVIFPQVCHRLQVPFYRTKVTSWMASQEEDYRFILLEADASEDRSWAQLCVEQVAPSTPFVLFCLFHVRIAFRLTDTAVKFTAL